MSFGFYCFPFDRVLVVPISGFPHWLVGECPYGEGCTPLFLFQHKEEEQLKLFLECSVRMVDKRIPIYLLSNR